MLVDQETSLNGARLFLPDVFHDHRGIFKETYSQRVFGLKDTFVQTSCSVSSRGTMRGLHGDPSIAKLVTCLHGRVWDCIVDMNPESTTYRKWEAFVLTGDNHRVLYVPRGFAHGFLALTDNAVVSYQQTAFYNRETEFTVRWNDPTIKIRWPMMPAMMSVKDEDALFI